MRPQPLFVRNGDNGTEPIEGASQGKLSGALPAPFPRPARALTPAPAGLARLQCGKKAFQSDLGGLIKHGLSLGRTTVPTQKLVPLSHFEDEESASLHLRTPGHTDHNVAGWMFVLDWADMAGEGRVIAPELLHQCDLFLETAGLGTRSLSNRMGERAVGKLAIPAAGDMAAVEETNVYDMRDLDSVSRCNASAASNDSVQPLELLEVNEMSRMLPGLSLILDPVINVAMKPVINTFASTMGQDIMETMGEYLNNKCVRARRGRARTAPHARVRQAALAGPRRPGRHALADHRRQRDQHGHGRRHLHHLQQAGRLSDQGTGRLLGANRCGPRASQGQAMPSPPPPAPRWLLQCPRR